jgi:malate dehydrogenase
MAHSAHAVGRGTNGGKILSVKSGVDSITGVDCVVVTASAQRPSGANRRGGRREWLVDNLAIAKTIGAWLQQATPVPVVVVTNPIDIITYELYLRSDWPAQYFLGYSLSETARIADKIASLLDVPHEAVYCPVLGEHGENIVPVFSRATVNSDPIDFDESERRTVLDYVRDVPYTVMDLRGAGESSRWVTGRGASLLAQKVLEGGVHSPVGLSTPLAGEYGYSGVALSVPVMFGKTGVQEIVKWELSSWERKRFDDAYISVSGDISK